MWEIVSGAGCWNRATCARLSVSATCRREERRMYSARRMSKHFSDTRERIFRARFALSTRECREKGRDGLTLKYRRVAATLFGKSLKKLALGKCLEFDDKQTKDPQL